MNVFADCSDSKVNRLMFNLSLRQLEFPKGFTLRMRGYDSLEAELVADPVPTWSGEGLPPAGTVCEAKHPAAGQWCKVKILADKEPGSPHRVCRDENDLLWWAGEFRPIRTPEQIAEQEREMAVCTMAEELRHLQGPKHLHVLYGLYDLGYRKQVTP